MGYYYQDEPIPERRERRAKRPGAASLRPLRHASRSGVGESRSSWTMISAEELLGGYQPAGRRTVSGPVPEKIARLLDMMMPYQVTEEGRSEAFLRQARFMEDYEDDYRMEGKTIRHIFTAYQELSLDELRGYFAWRTQVRRGEVPRKNREFLRLYTAELINLIGAASPQDAFDRLLRVSAWEEAGSGKYADGSISTVLRDFIAAWDLDHELALQYCVEDPAQEAAKLALAVWRETDDHSLYAAIRSIAGEQIDRSRFLSSVEEDVCHVLPRVLREVSRGDGGREGKDILGQLLGRCRETPVHLFGWLPFETKQEDGYRYEVDPVTSFEYSSGQWTLRSYSSVRDPDAVRVLKDLIRECDRLMRREMHYKNALPARRKDPKLETALCRVIAEWLREKEERNRPEIRIDLSKLSSIRASADLTCERLLEGTEEAQDNPFPEGLLMNRPDISVSASAWNQAPNRSQDPTGQLNPDRSQDPARQSAPDRSTDRSQDPARQSAPDHSRDPGQIDAQKPEPFPQRELSLESLPVQVSEPLPAHTSEPSQPSFFTGQEEAFLRLLLEGGDWRTYLSERHIVASAFVDGINDKVYDELGDSVISMEGKDAVLIEDYREDLLVLLNGSDS